MRVVIDTNVFVSAAFKSGTPPYESIQWIIANGGLLKSDETEQEVMLVLGRPHLRATARPDFVPLLKTLLSLAEPVLIAKRITACRDPKDEKFLELAVSGGADVIVSGDADLLALHPFRGIPIETPADFLRRVRP